MDGLKQNLYENLSFLKQIDEQKIDKICVQLECFKQILNEFNQVHNLVRFNDINTQIIDSLKVLDYSDFFDEFNAFKSTDIVADIGSGAGFPALFLALFSKASFYLFEPSIKKAAFLRSAKLALKLENMTIIRQKVQDFKPDFKAKIITSRALMRVKNLIELCKNLQNENTKFIFYKGSELQNELKEAKNLFKNEQIYENNLRKYCILN